MKKLFFLALLGAAAVSCNNETCTDVIQNQGELDVDCGGPCSACEIEYPAQGLYGQNLLHGDADLDIPLGDFSLRAEMKEGSSLKIKLTKLHGEIWFYVGGTDEGWAITTMTSGPSETQSFEMLNSGTADVNFNLPWSAGSFRIDYYENSTDITKSKTVSWG